MHQRIVNRGARGSGELVRVAESDAVRQALEPEVLADAISDVLGVAGRYGDEPKGTRAVTLVDPKTRSVALDILGRCSREESCESPTGSTGGLQRKLHLFNGALLNARIAAPGGRLDKMIAAKNVNSGTRTLQQIFYGML